MPKQNARRSTPRSAPRSSAPTNLNVGSSRQQERAKTSLMSAGRTVGVADAERASRQSNLPVATIRRMADQMGLGIGRNLEADRYQANPSRLAERTRANRRAMEGGMVGFDSIRNYNTRRFGNSSGGRQDARDTFDRGLGVNQQDRIRSAFQDPLAVAGPGGSYRSGFAMRGGGVYNPNDVFQTSSRRLTDDIRSRINPNLFIGQAPSSSQGRFVQTNDGWARMGTQGNRMSVRQARLAMTGGTGTSSRSAAGRSGSGGSGGGSGMPREGVESTSRAESVMEALPGALGVDARVQGDSVGLRTKRSRVRQAGTLNRGTGRLLIGRTGPASLNIAR